MKSQNPAPRRLRPNPIVQFIESMSPAQETSMAHLLEKDRTFGEQRAPDEFTSEER